MHLLPTHPTPETTEVVTQLMDFKQKKESLTSFLGRMKLHFVAWSWLIGCFLVPPTAEQMTQGGATILDHPQSET